MTLQPLHNANVKESERGFQIKGGLYITITNQQKIAPGLEHWLLRVLELVYMVPVVITLDLIFGNRIHIYPVNCGYKPLAHEKSASEQQVVEGTIWKV